MEARLDMYTYLIGLDYETKHESVFDVNLTLKDGIIIVLFGLFQFT